MSVSPYGTARVSKQRLAIANAIDAIGGAFTADDVSAALRQGKNAAGVATVYRAIAALEDSGWLERVGARGTKALYARCRGGAHHHHAVCTSCGLVLPTDCPIASGTLSAEEEHGFKVTAHEVTLYGLCRDCVSHRAGGEA